MRDLGSSAAVPAWQNGKAAPPARGGARAEGTPPYPRPLRPETRLVLAETYTNPLMRAQDVPRLAELVARVPGARLVIDSTIATPWGLRRQLLEAGVAIVVGSLTKALGGEDVVLGGYIAT